MTKSDLLSKERYLQTAQAAGLTEKVAQQSWELYQITPYEQAPSQLQKNLVLAYGEAWKQSGDFHERLKAFGEQHRAGVRFRPGTVKDANRSIEKMGEVPTVIPTDLLAGTLIARTLERMYDLAELLNTAFTVVSFRDRMRRRLPSGYGDLQFLIDLNGHLAELKIVHTLFQDIDRHEHRVYEVVRSIEATYREELPLAERIVVEALTAASQQMYTAVWKRITADEQTGEEQDEENL